MTTICSGDRHHLAKFVKALRKQVLIACILALTTATLSDRLSAQQTPSNAPPKSVEKLQASNYLNNELPRWIRLSGEYRSRVEGFTGGGFRDVKDMFLLSRLRLNVTLSPVSWLRIKAQAQDARVFWKDVLPKGPPYANTMDLRMAYVEIMDPEKKKLGFTLGRQELMFGDQRLLGNVNWLNTARTFDAARATFSYKGFKVDAFAAAVVNSVNGNFDRSQDGNDIHGVYGSTTRLVPKATVEPYFFWRVAPRQASESGKLGNLDSKTVGLRWVGKVPLSFDYGMEVDMQRGSLGTDQISAWAGHWVTGKVFSTIPYKPRLVAEFNYASGDNNAKDGKRGTFDQLYPTAHDKYGLADQVGWRNIQDLRAGVEVKPQAKLLLTGFYHNWWLANTHDGLYNATGALVVRVPNGSAGRHVGQEVDVQATYSASKQVAVAGGYGNLFPGTFLKSATPGKSYRFPYLMVTYSF